MTPSTQIPFIGRQQELSSLAGLRELPGASMVIVSGRRRIGKSRLIEEFGKTKAYYGFSGLPPAEEIGAQDQRNEFARQLQSHFNFPPLKADDWGDLFSTLAQKTIDEDCIILIDEISWMAQGDPSFLGKLKIIWDTQFSKNPNLVLVLCSSVSSWLNKNLLGSTGFLGRPTLNIVLDELPLKDCAEFWHDRHGNISAYEKLKVISVTGGVPRYLEMISPNRTAEENIHRLCFSPDSQLLDEFDNIFTDIYGKRSTLYQSIIQQLTNGPKNQVELSNACHIEQSRNLSEYLDELTMGGFVARDFTWSTASGKASKLSTYRLKDSYMRFYLKYIEPNIMQIRKGQFIDRSLASLPNWYTILGLQFENLVINNAQTLIRKLGIPFEDIVFDNPYFQRKTARHDACQIDYMIQTRHDCVYACEIKFSRHEIKADIIEEMQTKLKRLKTPRNMSRRPILIHVNGVSDEVLDSQYFAQIIDFSELLAG
ncbi:MAG: ATPase [Legionellales bacterium]|nr:ATPase [Legionellales bacterium]|tara:strand:- start:28781 stop:30229 length:1449 start_codon:yes stop_codon:yes gene_type:complete